MRYIVDMIPRYCDTFIWNFRKLVIENKSIKQWNNLQEVSELRTIRICIADYVPELWSWCRKTLSLTFPLVTTVTCTHFSNHGYLFIQLFQSILSTGLSPLASFCFWVDLVCFYCVTMVTEVCGSGFVHSKCAVSVLSLLLTSLCLCLVGGECGNRRSEHLER